MATPKPITDFDPLDVADVQSDDVLVVVDVHDTSQSSAGTTKTLTLAALCGSIVDLALSGVMTFTAAVSKLIPGATSFSIRNHANSRDNVLVTDAGDVTTHGALTSGGDLAVTGTGVFSGGTVAAGVVSNGAFTGKRFVSVAPSSPTTAAAGAHVNAVGISGTDAAGFLTCTATGANNGVILTVVYGAGYVVAPTVTVTAASASALQLYVDTSSTTGFSLSTTNNMTNGVTYTFYYQVIG